MDGTYEELDADIGGRTIKSSANNNHLQRFYRLTG